MSAVLGDPGSPPGQLAKIPSPAPASARVLARASDVSASASAVTLPLQLVRSYQIPADDPSYHRLLNWSWTYDSAVAAAAFAATGDQANSEQLLDQLAALQHADGSIELAFNTTTGESAPTFRAGSVAWVGLAASTYDLAFGSTRYLAMQQRAADYVLSLQTDSGLIRGGPDVTWVSTQHNLIAYVFLSRLAGELRDNGNTSDSDRYQNAAASISAAIDANLLVTDSSGTHFREGLNDPTQALDVQALGAMYLQGTGRSDLAAQVLQYAQTNFAIHNRSITGSQDPATYNATYAAAGPFSGYRPYAGAGTPDVLWAEGSGEMRLAEATLGQDTSALDTSIANWAAITSSQGQGPLQADRTSNNGHGIEYHVWPASTTAAWTALSQSSPAFFAAPLPAATTLVNDWTAVRGGNLITTFPDGRVVMDHGAGERRVLAGPRTATNYTVTANSKLNYGSGYGIYVRATVDSESKLTGYCVQLDHGYGKLLVRLVQNDVETSPLVQVPVPAGFDWGAPHTIVVTLNGNAMSVTMDDAPMIQVPDLTAAAAAATGNSSIVPPAAGGYGFRAWSLAQVTLQQMTVTRTR